MLKFLLACLTCSTLITSQENMAKVNNIDIWYETFGSKKDPALLLIIGACSQGILWHRSLCERFANEGFYVIRYDHRDMGLSTCVDFARDPYDLMDMTKDAIGILDDASVEKAHVFGVSMGGLIAELMAAHYPERIHSILLFGSSPDIRPMNRAYAGLPSEESVTLNPPTAAYIEWMNSYIKILPSTNEEKLTLRLEGWNKLNGNVYPLDEKKNIEMQKEFLSRLHHTQGIINHITLLRSPRSEQLVLETPSKIQVPTTIIHGSEDPIFPPDHGKALHHAIINSRYFPIEGLGHIPNDHFFGLYVSILKKPTCE